MVKISCIKDLEDVSDVCAKYIAKNELERLLTSYEIDDISSFGSLFVLEDNLELEDYAEMGLSEPINQNFEFVDHIIAKRCNRNEEYLFGCIVISDDYGIDILVRRMILTNEQLNRFKSDLLNRKYELKLTED